MIEASVLRSKFEADTSDLEGAMQRAGGQVDSFGAKLGRVGQIAGGFVLARGILDAPKALFGMAQAAADDAASVSRLQQAVNNTAGGMAQYGGQIDTAITQGQKLAFSDDETRNALSLLTAETGDSGEALARLSAAQNLARGTGMDLGAASKLLGKVTDDNVGVLKRYGIQVEKGASAQDLLNKVDQKFGGQAAAFAKTGAGQWAIFKDQLGEVQEALGYKLLPVFVKVGAFLNAVVIPVLFRLVDVVGDKLTAAFNAVRSVVERVAPVFSALGSYFQSVVTDGDYLNDWLTHLPTPIQGVVEAIGQLVAALIGPLSSAWQDAKNALATFKGALAGNWTDAPGIDRLSHLLGSIGTIIGRDVVPAVQSVVSHFSDFTRILGPFVPFVGGLVSHFSDLMAVLNPLGTFLDKFIIAWGDQGLAGALRSIPGIIGDIAGSFQSIGGLFVQLGKDIGTSLLGALKKVDWSAVGAAVLAALGGALSTAGDLGTRVVSALGDAFGKVSWTATAATVGSALIGALGTALSGAGSLASSLVSAIGDALGSAKWGDAASAAASALGTAWGALTDAGGYVLSWVAAGIGGIQWGEIPGTIAKGIGAAWGTLTDAAGYIVSWVSGSLGSIAWGDIPGTIAKGIGDAWSALTDAGTYLYKWIVAGITSVPWTEIASAVATFVGQAWSLLTDAALYLHDWLASGAAGAQYDDIAATISTNLGAALGAVQAGGGGLLSLLFGAVPDLSTIPGLDSLKTLIDDMQGYWISTINNLKLAWQALTDSFGPGSEVVAQLGIVWTNLKPAIEGVGIVLGALLIQAGLAISGVAALFTAVLPPAVKLGADVVTLALSVISDALKAINRIVGDLVDTVNNIVHGRWLDAWQSFGDIVTTASILVQNLAGDLLHFLNQVFGETLHAIADPFRDAWTAAAGYVSGMASDIEGKISGFVGSVQGFISDMVGTVESTISGMVGSVQGFIGDMVGSVEGTISGFVGSFQGYISDLKNTVVQLFTDLYNGAVQEAQSLATDALSAIQGLPGGIRDALADLYTIGYDALMGLKNGFIDAFSEILSTVEDWVGKIGDALSKLHVPGFSPLDEAGYEMGQMFVGGIASGMGGALPQVVSGVQSVGQAIAGASGQFIMPAMQTLGQAITDSGTQAVIPAMQTLGQAIVTAAEATIQGTVLPAATMSGSDIVNALVNGLIAGRNVWQDTMSLLHGDALTAIAQMQADLQGKLNLAMIAGDDTSELKQKLSAVSQIIQMWANNTGEDVQSAIAAMTSSDALQANIVSTWQSSLANLGDVISGKAKIDLLAKISELNNELAIAVAGGAPQAVIDGLNASLATTQQQLSVVGAEYAAAVKQGIAGGITPQDVSDAVSTAMGISDGSLLSSLQSQWDQINQAIAVGTAEGWSHDIIAAMQSQAQDIQKKLSDAFGTVSAAAAAGLLDPKALAAWKQATGQLTQIPLDQLTALLPKMKDFGVGMIGQLVDGVNAGTINLGGALDTLNGIVSASMGDLDKTNDLAVTDIIKKLQDLESQLVVNLAQALINGTDPSGIEANIAVIDQLLQGLQSQLDTTADSAKKLSDSLNNITGGPDAGGSAGGSGGGGGGALEGAPGARGYYGPFHRPTPGAPPPPYGGHATQPAPQPVHVTVNHVTNLDGREIARETYQYSYDDLAMQPVPVGGSLVGAHA